MKTTTFQQHQNAERLQRIHRAWRYLNPLQRAILFIRALYWSLPAITEIIKSIRHRFNTKLTYILYPAHWL